MAGFRDFQTGEVLTAANVNDFLAKQSVMKFADATARDTALGTAVGGGNALREGMVAYLDDADEVIAYDGTAWSALGAAGIGTNVAQTVKTDTFSTTSSSFGDITGLTVTITPTSSSSKILLIGQINVSYSDTGNDNRSYFLRFAGGNTSGYVGDADGNRTRTVTSVGEQGRTDYALEWGLFSHSMVYLDSPATTSAVTYSVQSAVVNNVGYVNRIAGDDSNFAARPRAASSITAIEVAA